MRNNHDTVPESKHGGRSDARNTGGAGEGSRGWERQRWLPRAAPVHRASTQGQSHPESHSQPPPAPRAGPRSHASDLWALGYCRARCSRGPGAPQQTRAPSPAPFPSLGACGTSPQRSTEHRGFPATAQPAAAPKPRAARSSAARPASPSPGGEAASAGGTESPLPCFGTPLLPERSAATGLVGHRPRGSRGSQGGKRRHSPSRAGSPALQVGPRRTGLTTYSKPPVTT